MKSPFSIETDGHVATLFLDNPDRRNAMGPEFFAELAPTVQKLDADPNVRAIVIAGKGPHFSTGLDLMRMAAELGPAMAEGGLAKERNDLFNTIARLRLGFDAVANSNKPFIAAIHGLCIGGGLDLIAACDIRLASENAKIGLRETKIAIVADMGSLERLVGIVGKGHMREMALTGRDIDAARALRIGLVNDVYPDEAAVLAAAHALAAEIAQNAPLVVQGTKEVIRVGERHGEEAGLRYAALWNAAHLASMDLREAMSAFVEKRKPEFKGR